MKTIEMVSYVAAIFAAVLLVSGSAMAFTITGGVVTVGASDVIMNQSEQAGNDTFGNTLSGYSWQFQYDSTLDEYAQNENYSTNITSGWANAVLSNGMGSGSKACSRLSDGSGGYAVVRTLNNYSGPGGYDAQFDYEFNFAGTGRTITQVDLSAATWLFLDSGNAG